MFYLLFIWLLIYYWSSFIFCYKFFIVSIWVLHFYYKSSILDYFSSFYRVKLIKLISSSCFYSWESSFYSFNLLIIYYSLCFSSFFAISRASIRHSHSTILWFFLLIYWVRLSIFYKSNWAFWVKRVIDY